VNDVMGDYTTQRVRGKKIRIPIRRHIDLFVWTHAQEKSVGVQHLDVFKVDSRIFDPAQFEISAGGTIKGGRP
jgi:hypothetical protein